MGRVAHAGTASVVTVGKTPTEAYDEIADALIAEAERIERERAEKGAA